MLYKTGARVYGDMLRRSAKWAVTELYPGKGSVGTWSHGQTYSVAIRSSDARVLKLTKLANTADALAAQRSVRQKCDKFAQAVGGGGIPKTPPVGGHAVPANFAGGWYNSTFTVPQSYFDQLAARAKAYVSVCVSRCVSACVIRCVSVFVV